MVVEFDKNKFFSNIHYLLHKTGKKIGELETEVGVSIGYISRTTKDNNSKPGIDFIMNVAKVLNVSIDTLLFSDLTVITPTEKYMISFLEKLKRDTTDYKLDWIRESAGDLNRLPSTFIHPMFYYDTFYEPGESDYPEEVSRMVFNSRTFDVHTYIAGDCYNLRLKNGAVLYLMNIEKSYHRTDDPSAYAKEAWLFIPSQGRNFLCSNTDDSPISDLVDELYYLVCEDAKHPKLEKKAQYVIDAFMKDDIEDDLLDPFEEALPFN